MEIKKNFSLTKLNTFHVSARAKYFIEVKSEKEVFDLIDTNIFKKNKLFILGGGSNVLFVNDYKGLVIKNSILGKEIINETNNDVLIKVGAGENWHNFVKYAVKNSYGGIENLALIPGTVGATPVQNIGAYGVEVKDVIKEVEGIFIKNKEKVTFTNKECAFDYRNSIFKNKLKNKVLITNVTFKLSKKPKFNIDYAGIKEELTDKDLNLENIMNAVVKVRNSKLPNPNKIGNAGSFFKNPLINNSKLKKLKKEYLNIPYFKVNTKYKIPAAWLIEQLGYKGKTIKNSYGVFDKHALILVNYGNATGKDIYNLAKLIKKDVKQKFNILLEEEVNIIKQ